MSNLLRNIRFYVLLGSVVFSVFSFVYVSTTIVEGSLRIIRLTQVYALTAVGFLYITLLAGPFCFTFRWFPFRGSYLKARRALGDSAFYFSVLHGCFAFFGELGGFPGLFFLDGKYLLAISLSFIALVILSLMAATSFDYMVAKLTYPKWKFLHRFVYLTGILILVHALLLGSHFQVLSDTIPQLFFAALAFLLFLELLRIDAFFKKIFPISAQTHLLSLPLIILYFLGIAYLFLPVPVIGNIAFGIHAQHILLARHAQQQNQGIVYSSNINVSAIPGLQGDRTKRFTVQFIHPDTLVPNQDTQLTFQIFDASNGNKVQLFHSVYTKPMHLIIVDSQLQYFNHIHPTQEEFGFTISTQFPNAGLYHIYIDFQPFGSIEQQFGFTLKVGDNGQPIFSNAEPDENLTKIFGQYEVTLAFQKPLLASDLSIGNQVLTFTIKDAKTKKPITTLKPYLASFGHLVIIHKDTFEYLHVHPTNLIAPPANANGGPTVEFLPLGMYGPIKPGIYRLFAQFNPDNNVMVADYTIKIQ